MKQAFCSLCATVVLALACGGFSVSRAQTPSATPDPFLIQLSSSPSGFRTAPGDISADGRLVVFESNGDLATDSNNDRNNRDGNREIFIADYAQRRIFQITDTKNVPKPPPSPTPTPTPTPTPSPAPTPTPVPAPTPADPAQIQIEIVNIRPMISLAPVLNTSNQREYIVVFSSNAPDPFRFDGVDTGGALAADGNTEIWIYRVPPISDVADLSSGANIFPAISLSPSSSSSFTRITTTPASLLPTPGAPPPPGGIFPIQPTIADDNRDATISDNGLRIAFISNGDHVPATSGTPPPPGNADRNPELFLFNREPGAIVPFVQATNTLDTFGPRPFNAFNQNPSLSSDGSVVAFISAANLPGANNNDDGNGRGNAEVYTIKYNGSAVTEIKQVTRTIGETETVNLFSPGRRLSRDGSLLAFESLAANPAANSATNESSAAIFVYNLALDTFVRVGPRATVGNDVIRFPTFTDYDPITLHPATLIFASFLNFRPDGTFPPAAEFTTGLNPSSSATTQNQATQVFATQADATTTNTFTRLTKHPVLGLTDFFVGIRPLASAKRERITYSHGGSELGTGNPDKSVEAFYLLSPVATTLSAPLSFFTGASVFPLPTPEATPTPSPSPTPTPSPSPSPSPVAVTGLAPGEFGIIRTTENFVGSSAMIPDGAGSEINRRPNLPVELNGVSVSVNGAAAGLYAVGSTSRQIEFVVPLGTAPGVATVVVNSRFNNGIQLRGLLQIVGAQPDIFRDSAGRAAIFNAFNGTREPFTVTTVDNSGNSVPTVLVINLTGVRGAVPAEVKVTIGTTEITGAAILSVGPNLDMPGWDRISFTLPASLAGSTDVPVVVTITRGTSVFSSPATSTAPLITISP